MDIFDARFGSYLLVAALLIVAPGPDMALVTRNALSAGRRAALFTAFGIGIGILGWALAAAIGVATLLERSALAFLAIKLVGAAYLTYLGVRALVSSVAREQPGAETGAAPPRTSLDDRTAVRQGILGNLLNPKAGVIFVSILPQFIQPGDPPLRPLAMLILFEVMLVAWLSLYGYVVSRTSRSRAGTRVRRVLERVTGIVLIGLGFRLAVERR